MKKCPQCHNLFNHQEWQCPKCEHSPKLINGYLAFAPEIIDHVESYDPVLFTQLAQLEAKNFWFRSRNRLIIWAIKKYFYPLDSFLELGCGTGYVLSGIEGAFPHLKLSGCEIFTQGLEIASQRLSHTQLFQMDALNMPFESEFDGIGSFDVLEHIQADDIVLEQMYKSLKPGGKLLLTVPQHPWLWSQADNYARHVRRYTQQELKDKVKKTGFKIIQTTSFISLILPLMILSRFSQPRKSYDPLSEFRISPILNALLEHILTVERHMIKINICFPYGGSLLLVAQKVES
jgi:SAM-dependent methyltransferase